MRRLGIPDDKGWPFPWERTSQGRLKAAGATAPSRRCLRPDLVSGWLFMIDQDGVKDNAIGEKVLAYKRLYGHFYGTVRAALDASSGGS